MTRLKKNNSGFSLVEVLVSLAIVGIIVVPLMGNFIASQNANRTLKMRQSATALAQSTIETLKGMNMKATAINFNVNDDFSLGGYVHGDVMELKQNGAGSYMTLSNSATGMVNDDNIATAYRDVNSGDIYYNPKSTGKYVYAINDIEDGINKYDVLVKFESDEYKSYVDGAGNVQDGYNSQSLSAISGLDSSRTALITSTEGIENEAALYFEAIIGDPTINVSQIKKKMYAETIVTISGTDSPTATSKKRVMTVEAKVVYRYSSYSREETIFAYTYGVDSDKHLERIYLLFNESSGSKNTNNKSQCDNFNIKVTGDFTTINPKLYIIKQGAAGDDCFYNIRFDEKAEDMFKEVYSNVAATYVNSSLVISKTSNFDKSIYTQTTDFLSGSAGTSASADENRIYEMTVYVYASDVANRYSNLITSISTTRREK